MQTIIKKSRWLVTIIMLTVLTAEAQNADNIIGKWKDADHPEKQVEMYKQGDKYFGKAINDQSTPSKNGTLIFKDLGWNDKTNTYKGVLINPENKGEFKIEIQLIGDNEFRFKVSRFIFTKSFTFKRIN